MRPVLQLGQEEGVGGPGELPQGPPKGAVRGGQLRIDYARGGDDGGALVGLGVTGGRRGGLTAVGVGGTETASVATTTTELLIGVGDGVVVEGCKTG